MVYKVSKQDRVLKGRVHLGGSKSISNRVLLMEAMMNEQIAKRNLSDANDTRVMTDLLSSTSGTLDAHDAGTAFRFMTAYLAMKEGSWILTGSERMKQRPIGDLVDPLRELGAQIEYLGHQHFPPLKITGSQLVGGRIAVHAGISSQFASALLMIAPYMKNGLTIELTGEAVSQPYIAMTLSLMEYFDVRHERSGNTIQVPPQAYRPKSIFIESDWSSASYFYEMAAFSETLELTLSGLLENSFQGDAQVAAFMKSFGVQTTYSGNEVHLTKITEKTSNGAFKLKDQPDLAPALFATCGALNRKTKFTGLEHLQYKESNREDVLRNELAKCGISIVNEKGSIMVDGAFHPPAAILNTHLDHRMAMAFAPLAMLCGEVSIDDPMVVGKSYPKYWEHLQSLGFQVSEY